MRRFTVPEDLGTPAGGVTLRGAWNFQTPSGWDTVYTAVFNSIERPVAPMLVVRVETDSYAHESEFRYVLQPGEVMSVDHAMPIGQAFFLPREPITLRECSEDEVAAVHRSQDEFSREKTAMRVNTAYGLPYSPHYFRKSRSLSQTAAHSAQEASPTLELEPGPVRAEGPTTRNVGRNDPCPCGSGKKYKKCHGAHPPI
jgi:hypothetical protein